MNDKLCASKCNQTQGTLIVLTPALQRFDGYRIGGRKSGSVRLEANEDTTGSWYSDLVSAPNSSRFEIALETLVELQQVLNAQFSAQSCVVSQAGESHGKPASLWA